MVVENLHMSTERGESSIWKNITTNMNRELLGMGVGMKHLKDYRNAIALLVRRTFGIKTMAEVDRFPEEVELFVLEMLTTIKERRKSSEPTIS